MSLSPFRVQNLVFRKNQTFSLTFLGISFCSKTQHHCWLIVPNKLSTNDRQIKLGKSINPLSVLCNQSNETWLHLDFTCLYARPT
jgi:hypothetical protein